MNNSTTAIMNYDPNMTLCGRIAKQTVRLTLGQWEYRETFEVAVVGNLTGLDVIRSAIENLYEGLPYEEIHNAKTGSTEVYATVRIGDLECTDEELLGEYWLESMLIAAEIISIEPAGTFS
ncbi:DUF5406 family protein [Escherichia coli O21:H21]|nr:DUF5406 domain-containing protein [Escherichia coli]EKE9895617.1 DUF5406 family protein [Escherichia coli]ELJ1750708.1 DUF5406 family protein [Escherichia coli]